MPGENILVISQDVDGCIFLGVANTGDDLNPRKVAANNANSIEAYVRCIEENNIGRVIFVNGSARQTKHTDHLNSTKEKGCETLGALDGIAAIGRALVDRLKGKNIPVILIPLTTTDAFLDRPDGYAFSEDGPVEYIAPFFDDKSAFALLHTQYIASRYKDANIFYLHVDDKLDILADMKETFQNYPILFPPCKYSMVGYPQYTEEDHVIYPASTAMDRIAFKENVDGVKRAIVGVRRFIKSLMSIAQQCN